MRTTFLLLLGTLLLSSSMVSQEIGTVTNGNYSISIIEANDKFSCLYSDVNTNHLFPQKAFVFPNKETIYSIIMDGFKNENNHQVFVQTDKTTIVKFEYKRIHGVMLLKIKHNNLLNNIVGETVFMNLNEIDLLFGKHQLYKI